MKKNRALIIFITAVAILMSLTACQPSVETKTITATETVEVTGPTITVTITVTATNQQPIEIVSVLGPLPEVPVNPGGPLVEITLKNVSAEPITSLTATLQLERDFTFEFAVTSSHPLLPTNSVSTQRRLIGGGFGHNFSYPLALEGTLQNGETFAYTKQVQIMEP
ncbi:hypothetical protein ACFLUX_00350 [Chloroflexota bacterium]